MTTDRFIARRGGLVPTGLLAAFVASLVGSGVAQGYGGGTGQVPVPGTSPAAEIQGYKQENLVADDASGKAKRIDANLVNPWGIASAPGGPLWIADNKTGVSTVYLGNGQPGPTPATPLVVTVPAPPSGTGPASPTGIVYNGTAAFPLATGQPALFLFATEDGTISGWSPNVDMTHAVLKVDNSATAIYKGLAVLNDHLYAANFKANSVDVYNSDFTSGGSFTDTTVPAGFAPFGIQNVGGVLFVTYAMQDADKHDDVKAPGNGFVDIFNPDTHAFTRVASQGTLNSPWALAMAPADFGAFSNMLLVGNFGDGRINAYNPTTLAFLGQLSDAAGTPISIDGLWALSFGTDPDDPTHPSLYFTAGPADEAHGLFGRLSAVTGTGNP